MVDKVSKVMRVTADSCMCYQTSELSLRLGSYLVLNNEKVCGELD